MARWQTGEITTRRDDSEENKCYSCRRNSWSMFLLVTCRESREHTRVYACLSVCLSVCLLLVRTVSAQPYVDGNYTFKSRSRFFWFFTRNLNFRTIQFGSKWNNFFFKLGKPICASPRLSEVFPARWPRDTVKAWVVKLSSLILSSSWRFCSLTSAFPSFLSSDSFSSSSSSSSSSSAI